MTINIQLFQDSGPVVDGHGTNRIPVNNIGWKNSPLDESNSYVFHPLQRPTETPFGFSYTMYHYIKISGTYSLASRPRFIISGNIIGPAPEGYESTDKTRLFLKTTNVYKAPSNKMDGSLIFTPPGTSQLIIPRLSTVGPEVATETFQYLKANTTYYSEYLVTQIFVEKGDWTEYGNLGQLNIKITVDEYENTDV